MNTFGNIFRLTTFGESHAPALGGVIDGLPPGSVFSLEAVASMLARRAPGTSMLTTQRKEPDRVEFLSGLMTYDPVTGDLSALTQESDTVISLGTPVGFVIRNSDARSKDYNDLRHICRPSHADYAWNCRFGIRDWRGGGRSSGRETVSRVVGGAFAFQSLAAMGISIDTRISSIAGYDEPSDSDIARIINNARMNCDSVGGFVSCSVSGLFPGVGDPVFGKLEQMLSGAILSIGAVKGIEFGMGFEGCRRFGSEVSDRFDTDDEGTPVCPENYSGGIQGGISNGMPVTFSIAVKPTPTIARPLKCIDDKGEKVEYTPVGRHDPCILLRILPVIEAMAAMTVYDAVLMRYALPPKVR
ncbi:MAG: chorismate synthase [Bacteroidales bacterium]|nr:chorismate synthase [Bacteroidales bacterium]